MRRVFHTMRKRWKNRDGRAKLYIFRAFSLMRPHLQVVLNGRIAKRMAQLKSGHEFYLSNTLPALQRRFSRSAPRAKD
jgi:hypothetical protein